VPNELYIKSDIELKPVSGVPLCRRSRMHGLLCASVITSLLSHVSALTLRALPFGRAPRLQEAVPTDFWGIRDLVLVGYSALFMKHNSTGMRSIQEGAVELTEMLPQLHPFPLCRSQLKSTLAPIKNERERIIHAARVCLSCLPGKVSVDSFDDPFIEEGMDDIDTAQMGKMPEFEDTSSLSVCRNTQWPRTCSYWVSLHAMSYRADLFQLSHRFMNAVVKILAGGALMCHGCTDHFRLLHKPVLSPIILRDTGDMF